MLHYFKSSDTDPGIHPHKNIFAHVKAIQNSSLDEFPNSFTQNLPNSSTLPIIVSECQKVDLSRFAVRGIQLDSIGANRSGRGRAFQNRRARERAAYEIDEIVGSGPDQIFAEEIHAEGVCNREKARLSPRGTPRVCTSRADGERLRLRVHVRRWCAAVASSSASASATAAVAVVAAAAAVAVHRVRRAVSRRLARAVCRRRLRVRPKASAPWSAIAIMKTFVRRYRCFASVLAG